MHIVAFSPAGERAIESFIRATDDKETIQRNQLRKRMALCLYQISLITTDSAEQTKIYSDKKAKQLTLLFQSWKVICDRRGGSDADKAWTTINSLGDAIRIVGDEIQTSPSNLAEEIKNIRLYRFSNDSAKKDYFILLDGKEEFGLSLYYIYVLTNIWQMEQGKFVLHAAGLVHHEKLFLFTGPSGAGKSTVVSLSKSKDVRLVDEDQVLIYPLSDQQFSADAWGYDIYSCEIPLKAIFILTHARNNKLFPLTTLRMAHTLVDRHFDVMREILFGDSLQRSFRIAANIARHVPGFELQFKKTPEFWNLIDERFPD
jgi:hypothetical protein